MTQVLLPMHIQRLREEASFSSAMTQVAVVIGFYISSCRFANINFLGSFAVSTSERVLRRR